MKKFFLCVIIAGISWIPNHIKAQEIPDSIFIINSYLEDIEVVATSVRPITNNFTRIEAPTINLDNTGQNLPYLLQNQPSLVATSDDGLGIGYTYFRIRGTDQTRINTTINGVPLNEAETQTVYWVNISDMAGQIKCLDIQRGVGTSQNGSASFGASVNIETPREVLLDSTNHAVRGSIGFNGGMYNTFREWANIQSRIGHWSIRGRFTKVNSDGYIERAKSDLYSYFGYIGYANGAHQIDLTFFGGKEKTYMAWYGVSQEQININRRFNPAGLYIDTHGDTAYYDNQTDNYSQQHFHLRYTTHINQEWKIDAVLHYMYDKGYYEQYNTNQLYANFGLPNYTAGGKEYQMADIIDQKHMKNHFYGGLINARYTGHIIDLQMGTAVNQNRSTQWGKIVSIQEPSYPLSTNDREYYRNLGIKTDANIFGKLSWHIIRQGYKNLTIYTDIQYRFIDYTLKGLSEYNRSPIDFHHQFHLANPKAGISYTNHGHLVYLTFAWANREPSRSNYVENGTGLFPKPERLFDYEVGYQYRSAKWHLGVNLYAMDYYDQLVLTGQQSSITGGYLTTNVPRSYRIGAELTAGIKMTEWLNWQGNVTFSRNKIGAFNDYVDVYDKEEHWLRQEAIAYQNTDIAFSPSIIAGSLFCFDIKGFTARIQTQIIGHQYLDNTMSIEAMLKAYTTTNVNMQYTLPIPNWWGKVHILAQINNIFNSKYISNGGTYRFIMNGDLVYSSWYFPQAGINVHAGFIVDL